MFAWFAERARRRRFRHIADVLDEAEAIIDAFPIPPAKPNGEAAIVVNMKSASDPTSYRRLFLDRRAKEDASAVCTALANIARYHAGDAFEGVVQDQEGERDIRDGA